MNNTHKLYNIPLLTILSTFIVTYFVYNDFNIRFMYFVNYGILALLLLLVFISRIKNKQQFFNFSLIEILYIVIAGVVIINMLRPDTYWGHKAPKYFITMIIASGYVLLSKLNDKEENRIFKIILIITGIIAVCETIYRFFPSVTNFMMSISSEIGTKYNLGLMSGGYAYSMGASIPYVGYMMMFGIGASIALFYRNKNYKYLLITAFMFFVVIMLNRRSELLTIIVAIVATFFILDKPEKRLKHFLIFIIAAICFSGLILLLLPVLDKVSFLSRYVATIENLFNGKDISSGRFTLYEHAIRAFCEHPFFGVGWANFQNYTNSDWSEVHNIYLQFMCELGIFAAILITGSMITLFVMNIKLLNKSLKIKNEKCNLLLIFSFIVQVYVLFIGLLEPIFTNLIFLLIYALVISFISSAYKTLKDC